MKNFKKHSNFKMTNRFQLQLESILQVPIESYPKDFLFIVNGQEFQTSKFAADILSPIICNLHRTDQTFSEFTINTTFKGDFQTILGFLDFSTKEIKDNQIPFISEIMEKLGTDRINIINQFKEEININNAIDSIKIHQNYPKFHKSDLNQEIDFLRENFYDLNDSQMRDLSQINEEIIISIIGSNNLKLNSEDQLLKFITEICSQKVECSYMYEYVQFTNVTKDELSRFIAHFNIEYLTYGTWISLSKRLFESEKNDIKNKERYRQNKALKKFVNIQYKEKTLRGIFSYLRTHSNINDEVKVTYSSRFDGDLDLLLDIECQRNDFYTANLENSWICFEFKNHKIIPSSYTIRSCYYEKNKQHPKSWIVEGSENGFDWTIVDEQRNCSALNGSNLVRNFSIKNESEKKFKFIRIHQTERNWNSFFNVNCLSFCSIELYGKLF